MKFLTKGDVLAINRFAVQQTGEGFALRDEGLLESAVSRPKTYSIYENCNNVFLLGSVLAEAILQNHVFEQGNKRTALAALIIFIERNGWRLHRPDNSVWLAELILKLTTHEITVQGFSLQLSAYAVPH